jgi:hypothetical protein
MDRSFESVRVPSPATSSAVAAWGYGFKRNLTSATGAAVTVTFAWHDDPRKPPLLSPLYSP